MATNKGLVVTAHPAASEAGAAMLRAGGNAADAAVAAAYVLGVVEQFSAGVGGGGFLLYRDAKTGKTFALDYREVAPNRAHRDMYIVDGKPDSNLSLKGILAVAVPGMVPGLAAFQKRFGKKTLAESLDAAIEIADQGFEVLEDFHATTSHRVELLRSNPEAARVFLDDGVPYEVGDVLTQPDLAKTLRRLKAEGPKLFTHGAIAKAIADESARLGGIISLDDLKRFEPRWREPITGTYRGYQIASMPPPSSGGTHLVQMLRMLELDRASRGRSNRWQDPDDVHVLIEVMRRAYADRAKHMGDPAFHDVPLKLLLDDAYLKTRYASIKVDAASRAEDVGTIGGPPKEPNHTTHLVVIDRAGNCVSLTQTVNYGFGSGVVVPGTGILLNNEMDDFSIFAGTPNVYGLVGGEANSVQPGKIPLSSMTPTILTKDGKVRLALGSPGGSTIITSVLQAILHVIDHDMDLASAVGAPRIHQQWLPDFVRVEGGAMSPALIETLQARGQRLKHYQRTWGNLMAVQQNAEGLRIGVADPRGDGGAAAE